MALVRSAGVGSLETESDVRLSVGGAESNVAIGVARLGGTSTWVGCVGDDTFGRRIHRELRAEGVDTRIVVDERRPTGLMVKESPTSSSTRVAYYRAQSAGSALSADDLPVNVIASARVLHITGITPALSTTAADAVERAIDIAVDAKVPVSFDVNHRASLWAGRDATDTYLSIAARATIVFASADEARILVPEVDSPSGLARAIVALGPSHALIRLGAQGCVAMVDGSEYQRDAKTVAVIDTVGAGDAFVAGYLADFLAGRPTDERLDTAIAAGAFACMSPGDWEGLPRRADILLLDAHEPVTR